MESFLDYKKLFDFSLKDLVNDTMLGLRDEIIELNQVEQLSEGIDAKGQKIKTISADEQGAGNVYSFMAINERKAKGLQTNNVDLNFTGAFWKTFKVVKITGGWMITASLGMYGGTIEDNFDSKFDFLGLTDDNINYLINQELLPALEKRIIKKFKL